MADEVLNQTPPLVDYNLFLTDAALREAVAREGAGWMEDQLVEFGRLLGSPEVIGWGFLANEYPPVLHTHDRRGTRIDEVEFHPAWHHLMKMAVEHRIHNLPWVTPRSGTHVARAAMALLALQNEAGHICPISMTYSAAPVLSHDNSVSMEWTPRIWSDRYDPSVRPAGQKEGALIGMAMTEKQGGSDLRTNTTIAEPSGGREYLLRGHKWFCSAPMCDAFLVLAQAPGGLSCFLLPRWTPDGERNAFHLQRLKPKLGNRSNASSEVEFDGAWARLLGEEGRGITTIMEMVQYTRLDCAIGSAALMRRALVEAIHHARYRYAFGRALVTQPLMRNVLADLAVESEAATLLVMRLARALDEGDYGFARLAVAAGKYWLSKRTPFYVAEALECLGGNGFIEEFMMPRLYREAPLNSIWEGSGNVIALDVLRAIARAPETFERVRAEIRMAGDARIDKLIPIPTDVTESGARRFSERLVLALQASLLIRFAAAPIAQAFCASRLGDNWGHTFGTLPSGADFDPAIVFCE